MSGAVSEARTLLSLARGLPRHGSHAARLQAFYAPQAEHYDAFRDRLLPGRQELIRMMAPADGATVVELGGGTGQTLDFLGDRLDRLARVEIVDLCPALLDQARLRAAAHRNVHLIEADATTYRPDRPVDQVYFSYSLTMIPDWRAAIDNAIAMLRPGGLLGAVDFYVSGPDTPPGRVRHSPLARAFWPRWFAHAGVHPSPDHIAYLRKALPEHGSYEQRAPVPYLPLLRAPYYIFVGRRDRYSRSAKLA